MKKTLALLLAALMLLSLCACAPSQTPDTTNPSVDTTEAPTPAPTPAPTEPQTDEEKLVGTWEGTLNLAGLINFGLTTSGFEESLLPETALVLPTTVDFKADGSYAMKFRKDSIREDMEAYLETLMDAVVEYTYQVAEKEGLSRADLDAYYADQGGVRAVLLAELDMSMFDSLPDNFTDDSGIWKIEDSLLYMSTDGSTVYTEDNDYKYILGDNTLTLFITDSSSGLSMELTLTRK